MKRLEKHELLEITGGSISGSLINSLARGIEGLMDLGRSLGTAIRRISGKKLCSL